MIKKIILIFAIFNVYSAGRLIVGIVLNPFTLLSWQLLPLNLLAIMLLLLAYGYYRKKIWAWYLTFPQVCISIAFASTSFSFLLSFAQGHKSQLILSGVAIFLEIIKGIGFFSQAIKEGYFYLSNASRKYKHTMLFSSVGIIVLLIIYFVIVTQLGPVGREFLSIGAKA